MTFTRRQFLQAGALMIAQAKAPSGGIFLSGPSSVAIRQGQTISLTYQLTKSKGQSLLTSYLISGLPRGLTAKFLPTACKPNCQTTLTLTAAPDALPGGYTLLIRAQNSTDVAMMTTFSDIVLNPPAELGPVYGLVFPQNGSTDRTVPMTAIRFVAPQSNGLPIWGPSNAGVTVIRKIKPAAQTGTTRYVAQFWWSQGDGNFSGDNYWGMHPYPNPPPGGANGANWEIATEGNDWQNNLNGKPIAVVNDVWYIQAIRVTRNADTTVTLRFYMDLPNVDNDHVIQRQTAAGYGTGSPRSPQLTIGDSPWHPNFQHETFSGVLGPIKIFDKVLSEADTVSEAGNMTQLVTSDGAAHIWWGKTSFDTVDDLTCDYGTRRSFTWSDASHKATLELIS